MQVLSCASKRLLAGMAFVIPSLAFGQENPSWTLSSPGQIVAGELVTLKVTGLWRNSCVPRNATLSGSGFRRVLTLGVLPSEISCSQALTPYSVDTAVRFEDRNNEDVGTVHVAIVSSEGEWLGEQDLTVQGPSSSSAKISAFNVDGAWYFPETSGSGLTLSHDKTGKVDSVWGFWTNYGPTGSPQWYLFQDAKWESPTRLVGKINRLASEPFGCTRQFPNPDCDFAPRSSVASSQVGDFEIEFESSSSAVLIMRQGDMRAAPVPLTKLD